MGPGVPKAYSPKGGYQYKPGNYTSKCIVPDHKERPERETRNMTDRPETASFQKRLQAET